MKAFSEKNVIKTPEYSIYHAYGIYSKDLSLGDNELQHNLAVVLFKQWDGYTTIEGRKYEVANGDIFLLRQDEIRSSGTPDGTVKEYISLCIDLPFSNLFNFDCTELFKNFYNHESGIGNRVPAEVVSRLKLDVMMEELMRMGKDRENNLLIICKIVEILVKLNEAAEHRIEAEAEDRTVSKVIKYIAEHFTENINCVSIADEFGLSRFRLEHLFKLNVGVSLWDYVILRRLIYFDELVQEGTGAKEAAQRAGFNNYSNFYRLYKKHMGITPAESKKRAKNN